MEPITSMLVICPACSNFVDVDAAFESHITVTCDDCGKALEIYASVEVVT